jgi:hypothetical protein
MTAEPSVWGLGRVYFLTPFRNLSVPLSFSTIGSRNAGRSNGELARTGGSVSCKQGPSSLTLFRSVQGYSGAKATGDSDGVTYFDRAGQA